MYIILSELILSGSCKIFGKDTFKILQVTIQSRMLIYDMKSHIVLLALCLSLFIYLGIVGLYFEILMSALQN
ncbi:hypothetical protein V1478_007382 [Vespula squamosa]|uniref:Uncharacterized protein n=1 Tax=Vespula squamosa TaxID=30214 RepID=A0ABD2B2Z1_VESSQ